MKETRPLISIIINCFNGEKYLKECLNSVEKQDFDDYEVVFWDNNSTDDSRLIYQSFSDERFKYFNDYEHVNLYHARNKALKKTKGKFITFLDVDDLWYPFKLTQQIKTLEDNPDYGFCYSNFHYLDENKNKLKKAIRYNLPSGNIQNYLLKKYNVCISSLMFKQEIALENKLEFNHNYKMIGDLDFVLKFAGYTKGIGINKSLVIYRRHEDNLTRLKYKKHIQERNEWLSNEIKSKNFATKDLQFFKRETNYQEFYMSLNKVNLKTQLKLLIRVRGIFLLKALFFLNKKLLFKFIKKFIKYL